MLEIKFNTQNDGTTEYLDGKPIIITEPEEGRGKLYIRKVRFNRKMLTIEFLKQDDLCEYDLDLEEARTADEILAFLFHAAGKTWMTPQVLGAAIKILRAVVWEAFGEMAESAYCHENKRVGVDWSAWKYGRNKRNR